MKLFLLKDPAFARSFWCCQYERGIGLEASQGSIELVEGLPPPGDAGAAVCLISSTPSWIEGQRSELARRSARGILLASSNPDGFDGFSSVSIDYRSAMWDLLSYFRQNGRKRTALFGSNPSSTTDALKVAAYLQFADRPRVWENRGELVHACGEFAAEFQGFDSVICCSDLIAAELGRHLRESGVRCPEQLWMAGFGDTVLAEKVRPSITTVSCDYVSIGRQAVKIAAMLARNLAVSAISLTIRGTLVPRESTGSVPASNIAPLPPKKAGGGADVDFYDDSAVSDLLAVENLLSRCEAVDFELLRGIARGVRYSDLSDACFLSENAVKYRIKRMRDLAGKESRRSLLDLVGRYIDPADIE